MYRTKETMCSYFVIVDALVVCIDWKQWSEKRLDMLKCFLAKLEIGPCFSTYKASILVTNNEARASQLSIPNRHVSSWRYKAIDYVLKMKHAMKVHGNSLGLDADAEKLGVWDGLCPSFHLCRTRAAPASSAVVKMNDRRLARRREQTGGGSQPFIDIIESSDQMNVKVSNLFTTHCGYCYEQTVCTKRNCETERETHCERASWGLMRRAFCVSYSTRFDSTFRTCIWSPVNQRRRPWQTRKDNITVSIVDRQHLR